MARGKKVYNSEQRALLEHAEDVCARFSVEKAGLRLWLAREAERRMASLERDRADALNEALAAGVQKSDLLNALGVKNWDTLQRALKANEGMVS